MIPYFDPPSIHLGPFVVSPFGVLAALGIYVTSRRMVSIARAQGLDPKPLEDWALWGVGTGVVVGHLTHLIFYHPEEFALGPLQIFKFWEGLSSFGGLLGGVLAARIFFRVRHVSFRIYEDALALAVAPGWAIARVGCFAIHDHPGVRSHFFLAVHFPGGPRHDLGLYDALWLAVISLVLAVIYHRGLLKGRLLPLLGLLYGLGRFGFDFLRAKDMAYVDSRYFGLTPAQYACMALWAYGVIGLMRAPVQPAAAGTDPALSKT